MTDTQTSIAAGLERAFASNGFAEPNIETLRAAAGVSLRTLYKYTPSRDEMVLAALEHRHERYLSLLFRGLPEEGGVALDTLLDRVANWMKTEATHGCLFHSAVAAAPNNAKLRHLLERHKADVGQRAAEAVGLPACVAEITVIMEGLTQSWALLGEQALVSAKRLGGLLR